MNKRCVLTIIVEYDDKVTHPDALASAADTLLEIGLATGALEEYGDPVFGSFVYDQEAGTE